MPAHETAHLIGKTHLKNKEERTDEERKKEHDTQNLLYRKALGGTSLSEKQKNDIIDLILKRKKVGNGNPMIMEGSHIECE